MSFHSGDLVRLSDQRIGEVVGVVGNTIEVSWLHQTQQQQGKIYAFGGTQDWDTVPKSMVVKHVSPGTLVRPNIVRAWREMGFIAGGDGITFCRIEDEETVTLPMYEGAEEESDEEVSNEMDDFIVPDEEGEAFTFADPSKLDGQAKQFVLDTHQAVKDFERWEPSDQRELSLKRWIQACESRVAAQHDNRVFAEGGAAVDMKAPPTV